MKVLYKFRWDLGRTGDVQGLFVEDDEFIRLLIGEEIYFGEICGKHSEIYGILEEREIEKITDDEKVISIFEEYNLSSGYNPAEYFIERLEDFGGTYQQALKFKNYIDGNVFKEYEKDYLKNSKNNENISA